MILSRPPLRTRPQERLEPRRMHPSEGLVEDLLAMTQRLRRAMRFGHSLINLEIQSLCRFLGQERKLAAYQVCGDPRLEPAVRALQAVADRAGCELEKELARQLCGDPTRRNAYLGQVGEFARWEARCAQIGPRSKVLFVGGGALPVTALTLVRELGCQVTCLDRDRQAADLARKALAQLDCPTRLEVIHGSLADVDVESYTHVWVASLVPNKAEVLAVLARRAHPSVRVLVRFGEGLQRIFNYELEASALRGWLTLRRLERKGHLHSTVLLSRESLHFSAPSGTGPLGNVLIVGAGPVAISYATLLSRPGHCRRVEMLTRASERAQRLVEELRSSGGQVGCQVSASHLQGVEGSGQLHALHFSARELPAYDTVILAVPAGAYRQAAQDLNLRPGTLVVLPSAALGSAVELQAELGPHVTVASFSNFFAAAKPGASLTQLLVRGLKRRVYLGLTRPDPVRSAQLVALLGSAGVEVCDLGRAAAAESRNITTFVHPALFIDEVALDSILRFEPSLKKMYKLYPEGPLTKASMETMVRLSDEIAVIQRALGIAPVNLLKFLNDDNYPVHERTLSREEIEAFPELDFNHRVLLLYVRYTALLVDPFSEPDPVTGRYQDFSAVAFPHARRLGGSRVELPRIPREDYETLRILASLAERFALAVPQLQALCERFERAVVEFEARENVTTDLDLGAVAARAERLARLL